MKPSERIAQLADSLRPHLKGTSLETSEVELRFCCVITYLDEAEERRHPIAKARPEKAPETKLLVSDSWQRSKIASDPEVDTEAGLPLPLKFEPTPMISEPLSPESFAAAAAFHAHPAPPSSPGEDKPERALEGCAKHGHIHCTECQREHAVRRIREERDHYRDKKQEGDQREASLLDDIGQFREELERVRAEKARLETKLREHADADGIRAELAKREAELKSLFVVAEAARELSGTCRKLQSVVEAARYIVRLKHHPMGEQHDENAMASLMLRLDELDDAALEQPQAEPEREIVVGLTCQWHEEHEADDGTITTGPDCGEPATYRSCIPYMNTPTCAQHKCRCAKPIASDPPVSEG